MKGASTGSSSATEHAILKGLNTAQRLAVICKADVLAILAGPGSGKTHTLTARVVWLLDHVGFEPQDVIVATFTVKAAKEMKERITRILGEERAKKIVLGTFHSIARKYIAAYGDRIGIPKKFSIADDSDTKAIIKRIRERLGLNNVDISAAKEWISHRKVRGPQPVKAFSLSQAQNRAQFDENMVRIYTEYQDHLERSDLLDYDDLLVKGVELLERFPGCVKNVQTVLIDEYQDTNHIQFKLMKLFASARGRITIVGDPDQSIYGWRSADLKNFEHLFRDYPDHVRIALEENYRSSGSIIQSSLDVIRQDGERIDKTLTPTHRHGIQPVLRKLKTNTSEGDWIVEELQRITTLTGGMLKYQDCAILLRSAYLSRQVESALGRAGISYRMIGGLKFYERFEIKLLLDYLRVIYQPDNNDALVRIINTPKRGIGETTIKNLLEEAETEKRSLWNILFLQFRGNKRPLKTKLVKPGPQMISTSLIRIISGLRHRLERAEHDTLGTPFSLIDLVEELVRELDFIEFIKKSYPQEHEGRLANIQEFMTLAGDFMRENQFEESLPEVEGLDQRAEGGLLGKFLTNVALATDAQTGESEDLSSTVTISTIHAAKGLEWPVVFVPAVYNGSLPHARSENDDEERRLLYVAMTRAKALLYLSYPLHKAQHGNDAAPSQDTQLTLSDFIPAKIAASLRAKGPMFEQKMVNEMAKILGREAPSLSKVFRELPTNIPFNPNDENYPVDPNDVKRGPGGSHYYEGQHKRQRMYSSQPAFAGQGNGVPWQKDYSTTMEKSSGFTVASTTLPGFTTAGAHRVAIAAHPPSGPHRGTGNGRGHPKGRGRGQPPPGTRSLLGAGRGQMKVPSQVQLPVPRIADPGQVQMTFNRPLDQASIIETTRRGLQDVRRRVQARAAQHQQEASISKTAAANYPGFSSPPKGEPAAPDKADQENRPSEPSERSAGCLHATTMSTVKGPASSVISRPPGLARAGMPVMTPLDKLRKPFQPLSVARGGNGHGPAQGNTHRIK